MVTYKEQIKDRKTFVLLQDNEVIATFGNLKKVCDFLEGKDFYSYNTIIRKKDFPVEYKNYKVFKVKHF